MVTIALDATYAADPDRTGTGVYSERLIHSLAAAAQARGPSDFRLNLCFRLGPYARWARKQPWPANASLFPFWEPWWKPPAAQLFHGLNQRLPERPYPVRVVTIHDLFPVTSADYSTREFQSRFSKILHRAIALADRIIAVSDATRRQLLQHTDAPEDRIAVIHHGVDPAQPATPAEQERFREGVLRLPRRARFFLNVGAVQTRKNVANIVRALKRLPEFYLALAGGDGFGAEQIYAAIEAEGLSGRVIRLGHTRRETLRLLYSTATALVFASLEEGFGLPILEAMSYGLPVITSRCSAMPEVAGDAALYVDPLNVEEISEAMRRIAEEEALAGDLRRRGAQRVQSFRWEKCAEQTWNVYQEALAAT